jgi:hypothetical protein
VAAQREHPHGTPSRVVPGIFDELDIFREEDAAPDVEVVVLLDDGLARVGETAVADDEADPRYSA